MRSPISTVLQTLSSETGKQLMDDKDFYFANGLPECCLAIASLVLLCHTQCFKSPMKKLTSLKSLMLRNLLTFSYLPLPFLTTASLRAVLRA